MKPHLQKGELEVSAFLDGRVVLAQGHPIPHPGKSHHHQLDHVAFVNFPLKHFHHAPGHHVQKHHESIPREATEHGTRGWKKEPSDVPLKSLYTAPRKKTFSIKAEQKIRRISHPN